jgi:DNA-binding HxlR family transcriptional regulator
MDDLNAQFYPGTHGAEALCERWTPLVVRELLCGSKRFNDLHRGVPRMSTSLLVQRLRHLEEIGIVRRTAMGKVWEYSLTDAGDELRPIIMALGHWGARWIGGRLHENELDAGLLMSNVLRSLRRAAYPRRPMVIHFLFHDARPGEQAWWLVVVEKGVAELCRDDPGRDPTLVVRSSLRALTEVWTGHRTPLELLQTRELRVEGASQDAESLWRWMGRDVFAVARSGRPTAGST